MKLKDSVFKEVAISIRPHITPFLEETGQVTDDQVRGLIKNHVKRNISSDHSIQKIQEYLADC